MEKSSAPKTATEDLSMPLERDVFLRTLIRELSGTLQEVVGLEEASGFISLVGQRMGDQINESYKSAMGVSQLFARAKSQDPRRFKAADPGGLLHRRAGRREDHPGQSRVPVRREGDRSPDDVHVMTSNVFGVIAAENLGYAKVVLEETIARGDAGCGSSST